MIALVIGFAIVGGVSFLTGNLYNLDEELGVLLFNVLVVAAPFAVLAMARESGRAAWLTAVGLTGAFWGLLVADMLIRRGAGGANIGLGLLMLLSPLVITAGAFGAAVLAKRRR